MISVCQTVHANWPSFPLSHYPSFNAHWLSYQSTITMIISQYSSIHIIRLMLTPTIWSAFLFLTSLLSSNELSPVLINNDSLYSCQHWKRRQGEENIKSLFPVFDFCTLLQRHAVGSAEVCMPCHAPSDLLDWRQDQRSAEVRPQLGLCLINDDSYLIQTFCKLTRVSYLVWTLLF